MPRLTPQELWAPVLSRYSQTAIAKHLAMTKGRISRVTRGGRLSASACLLFAAEYGQDPVNVLRAYDYEAEADALERSRRDGGQIAAADLDWLERWHALSEQDRATLTPLIERLLPARRRKRSRVSFPK